MEKLLDNYFLMVKNLWKEYWCFKKYKMLPKWAAIILGILLLPCFVGALWLTLMFAILYFLFYIMNVPTEALYKILKNEGKEVHFGTQIAIYFTCFPVVFLFYIFLAFFIPVFFILFFFLNVNLYIDSLGGIKFVTFLSKETERSYEPTGKVFSLKRTLVYTITAIVLFVLTIVFVIVFASEGDYDYEIPFIIFAFLFSVWMVLGGFILDYKYGQEGNGNEHVEGEQISETKQEEAKEPEEKVESFRGLFKIHSVLPIIFAGIAAVCSVVFASILADSPFKFLFITRYSMDVDALIAFGFISFALIICFVAAYIFRKTSKFSWIGLVLSGVFIFITLLCFIISISEYTSKKVWNVDDLFFVALVFTIIALIACVASIIAFFSKKKKAR